MFAIVWMILYDEGMLPIRLLLALILISTCFSTRGADESQKPLKVTGQRRGLSLVPLPKKKDERIDFVKIRDDYRKEILTTRY